MSAQLKDTAPKGRDYHLSLSGCGFLGLYHVGVISAFHEYARHLCVNKIAGASAGSLAAACLICNVAFGEYYSFLCWECRVIMNYNGIFTKDFAFITKSW